MNNESITIREAIRDDVKSLGELMCELGYNTNQQEMLQRFDYIEQHPDYKTFVALGEGRVVGMVGASQNYSYEQNGKHVRVLALVTSSSLRQKGIGAKLMQVVEDWARGIGATSVLLNCGNRQEREVAHEFYHNRGYIARSSGYVKKL